MVKTMSIKYDLTDTLVKEKLAVLPEKMLEWAFEVLMKQAELMKAYAQVYCPVDTGSLRDSIRVERGGGGLHWREVKVRAGGYVVNPKRGQLVNYALYVELRTPYMRPAYEEVKPTIAEMIRAEVVEKANE
jgi:hypothetical protein